MGSQENVTDSPYNKMKSSATEPQPPLTPQELAKIRHLLNHHDDDSVDSEYDEFKETTHAWAIFADDPAKRATRADRIVGTFIIAFQLCVYWIFATEAIEDYEQGEVAVMTAHSDCLAAGEQPQDKFTCEADFTNGRDAFVSFLMLGIFLTADFQQAVRAIRSAPMGFPLVFACLALFEVWCAFLAATLAVSQNLFVGEITDAVEVGVGLLFVRELSNRAYHGITYNKTKQYKIFFGCLFLIVLLGFCAHWLWEYLFAPDD